MDYLYFLYKNNYKNMSANSITFQVTDDCCCNCSYCYQTNKGIKYMNENTAKTIVDLLFQMSQNTTNQFINKNTIGLVLDFIGGEPLLNINIIDYICSYFMDKCLSTNHIWTNKWKGSMISNGALYFDPKVQNFLNKFENIFSFSITLDGPEIIHNKCRKYKNGEGNFNDAYLAFKDCQKRFGNNKTKVTISPENLNNINEIIDFFINEGITDIYANPIFENNWTYLEANIYYYQLKIMADKLLLNNNIYCSLFMSDIGKSLPPSKLETWCGGTGKMLAFDPDGNAYPCLRYMESSLGNSQPPLIIGNCFDGIYNTPETKKIYTDLCSITRRTQSTDECFYCPVASGCSYCSAYNYQCFGTANSRSTNICNMHKARVLANVYYWNLYYEKNNINKVFEMNLPKDDALNFIDEKEYNMLLDLVNSRKEKIKTL